MAWISELSAPLFLKAFCEVEFIGFDIGIDECKRICNEAELLDISDCWLSDHMDFHEEDCSPKYYAEQSDFDDRYLIGLGYQMFRMLTKSQGGDSIIESLPAETRVTLSHLLGTMMRYTSCFVAHKYETIRKLDDATSPGGFIYDAMQANGVSEADTETFAEQLYRNVAQIAEKMSSSLKPSKGEGMCDRRR